MKILLGRLARRPSGAQRSLPASPRRNTNRSPRKAGPYRAHSPLDASARGCNRPLSRRPLEGEGIDLEACRSGSTRCLHIYPCLSPGFNKEVTIFPKLEGHVIDLTQDPRKLDRSAVYIASAESGDKRESPVSNCLGIDVLPMKALRKSHATCMDRKNASVCHARRQYNNPLCTSSKPSRARSTTTRMQYQTLFGTASKKSAFSIQDKRLILTNLMA